MERLRKKELVIIFVMLICSLALIPLIAFMNRGNKVRVYVSKEESGTYSLDVDQEVLIETDNGINVLTIKDGKAMVTSADCKDQICVHMAPLSKSTPGIIVCLPHEVVIELRE